MGDGAKDERFPQDSNSTLAMWTHQCFEHIAHSIECEEKKWKIHPKHKRWAKKMMKDMKIQLNRMKRAY